MVLPLWSAVVDPHVLGVRAAAPGGAGERLFDALLATARVVKSPHAEHLLIVRPGSAIRLDVIEGTVTAGPVALHFDLADDHRLSAQISAISAFRSPASAGRRHVRLTSCLLALQAIDARSVGASLREIADMLLGPGDWPGDGEYRKSHVRRLLVVGADLACSGFGKILGKK